jgi:DNA-binding NtrC family response regulator
VSMKTAILIIDDDESVSRTFMRILEKNGYVVEAVRTGTEALKKLEETNYAVALIDLHLPDLSGTELLEKMSTTDDMVKIIITGSPTEGHPWSSAKKAADAFLQKPIKPETLLSTISEQLNKKHNKTE